MKILDLSAGNRAVWFNKSHPMAIYLDKRSEVKPTIVCDTRNIPESAGSGALMAFKWNTHDIKLERVFKLMTKWEPLFGHLTKDGPMSQTYWVMLRRLE